MLNHSLAFKKLLTIFSGLLILGMLISACAPSENPSGSQPTATPNNRTQAQITPTPTQPVASQPPGTGKKIGGTPLPANEIKSLVFNLTYNDAGMDQYMTQLYTPGSSVFHQFLTPEQIVQRFGPSAAQIQEVQSWLKQNGYTVVELDEMHSSLKVQASVATIQKSLGIQLKSYTLLGRTFFMQEGEPKLPANIARLVDTVIGLDNFALPEFKPPFTNAAQKILAASGDCANYGTKQKLTRNKLAAAYQMNQLYSQNILGQGMTIGVAEFGEPYDRADIANYMTCVGLPMPQIEDVQVDSPVKPGPGEGEAAMDVELIAGLAPQAKILVYQAGGDASFAQLLVDLFNKVAAEHRIQALSVSYGTGEDQFSFSEQAAVNRSLRTLAAEGISVFISSGDCGAFSMRVRSVAMVAFPASAPYAISVGGTHLQVSDKNVRTSETVWGENDLSPLCANQWGTGGGVSQNKGFKRPVWQSGPGIDTKYDGTSAGIVTSTFEPVQAPNGLRQVPDIAAAAFPNIAIYHLGEWLASGGTSAAAPIVTAGIILVNQLLKQQGKAYVGSVQEFYNIANHPGKFHPYTDIVNGNNLFYPATPGWDYSTGWGTPNFSDLYQIELAS